MTFSFSTAQQNVINSYLLSDDYADAYLYAADQAEGGAGVPDEVIVWMRGAAGVNTHSTGFGDFIWSYTEREYYDRFGLDLSDSGVHQCPCPVAPEFQLSFQLPYLP